jgi:hypothetical protein
MTTYLPSTLVPAQTSSFIMKRFSEEEIKKVFASTSKNIVSQAAMLYYLLYYNEQFLKLKGEEIARGIVLSTKHRT